MDFQTVLLHTWWGMALQSAKYYTISCFLRLESFAKLVCGRMVCKAIRHHYVWLTLCSHTNSQSYSLRYACDPVGRYWTASVGLIVTQSLLIHSDTNRRGINWFDVWSTQSGGKLSGSNSADVLPHFLSHLTWADFITQRWGTCWSPFRHHVNFGNIAISNRNIMENNQSLLPLKSQDPGESVIQHLLIFSI